MGSAEAAELTKLAETTYRDVNIALANEFARFADRAGIDIDRVIDAANSQPFSHIHRPGIAVGGHCIPVYPRFYLAAATRTRGCPPCRARSTTRCPPTRSTCSSGALRASARRRAGADPRGQLPRGRQGDGVLRRVRACATSSAGAGPSPVATRPAVLRRRAARLGFEPWDGAPVDAAIVQADHAGYARLTPADLPGVRVVVDGRGVLDAGGVGARRSCACGGSASA